MTGNTGARRLAPFKLKPFVPLEKDVQTSILHLLARHPKVAWASRFNSGAAWLKAKGGRERPVKFNTCDGCSDILGQMRDGRFLAIEVKRPGWKKPKDQHEFEQEDFLRRVTQNRGVAFFATSPQEVADMLSNFT